MGPEIFKSVIMAWEHPLAKCIMLEDDYIEKEEISNGSKVGWFLIDWPSYFTLCPLYPLTEGISNIINRCN